MKAYQVLVGDCLQTLRTLPKQTVQCCITSPPYYQLRDYQTGSWEGGDPECDHKRVVKEQKHRGSTLGPNRDGLTVDNAAFKGKEEYYKDICKRCGAKRVDSQIGREETPEEYITNLVKVFRAVRRVLRDDGVLWVNIGETMRNKQLVGIPWRLAFAMQADGWILRSEVIWHKPNAMPQSVTDRPSTSHEQVFLFTKQTTYFYDGEAIKERSKQREVFGGHSQKGKGADTSRGHHARYDKNIAEQTNKRSVWTVATQPMSDAHFAAFPIKLIMPMVLAGTSEKGCCPKCRAPYKRKVEKIRKATRPAKVSKVNDADLKFDRTMGNRNGKGKSTLGSVVGNRDPERHVTQTKTVGWVPTCDCNAGEPIPCIILDPYCGSGTTLMASVRRNRHAIGCELNPEYVKIIHKRVGKALRNKGFGLV